MNAFLVPLLCRVYLSESFTLRECLLGHLNSFTRYELLADVGIDIWKDSREIMTRDQRILL